MIYTGHIDTLIPMYLARKFKAPSYERERIFTLDSDFIDIDWFNRGNLTAPTLVILHGVEGDSGSHYVRRFIHYVRNLGWRVAIPHHRGCSEEINLTNNFYHGGYTDDAAFVLEHLKKETDKLVVVGASIGGSILLNLLAKNHNLVQAAVAISVPFDLEISTYALDKGLNAKIYSRSFLKGLLPKMEHYASRSVDFIPPNFKIKTLHQLNEVYVSHFYNFRNASEYYLTQSSLNKISRIRTPLMILQAANDPMVPETSWPKPATFNTQTKFLGMRRGGHLGFMFRGKQDSLLYMPKLVIDFLAKFLV